MAEDMGIVTFICDSFDSVDTCLFSYLFSYENHELSNLHAKAETVVNDSVNDLIYLAIILKL